MSSIDKLLYELGMFKEQLCKNMNQSPTAMSTNVSDAASRDVATTPSSQATNISLAKDSRDPKFAPKERKIKELQRQIDAGTYKPDAGKIAEKIAPLITPTGSGGRIIPKSSSNILKADDEEISFNKCGQWSLSTKKSESCMAKDEKTKHDRCVEEVEQKSPEVKNPHAVCVAAGVEPEKWNK